MLTLFANTSQRLASPANSNVKLLLQQNHPFQFLREQKFVRNALGSKNPFADTSRTAVLFSLCVIVVLDTQCSLPHSAASRCLSTMTMPRTSLLCLLLACLSPVSAWIAPTSSLVARAPPNSSALHVASRDDLEYLPLSSSDLSRLTGMRERHVTLPLVILEPILPNQKLEWGSADPKFVKLLQHVLEDEQGEIAMIGMNPHTGRPLNIGVRCVMYCECSL